MEKIYLVSCSPLKKHFIFDNEEESKKLTKILFNLIKYDKDISYGVGEVTDWDKFNQYEDDYLKCFLATDENSFLVNLYENVHGGATLDIIGE